MIQGARDEGDDEALRTQVHQIKGSAGSYGFPSVSQCARRCQEVLRRGTGTEDADLLLDELVAQLSELADQRDDRVQREK